MKSKLPYIFGLLAGVWAYIGLSMNRSMCYYASGENVNVAREACYAQYGLLRFTIEILLYSLVAYFISKFFIQKYIKK